MKVRLDQFVFEEGYTESRQRAQALIMAGVVYVNNQKVDKAGYMLKETDKVEVRGKDLKYEDKSQINQQIIIIVIKQSIVHNV